MSALLLHCPRCGESIPHGFARLMEVGNIAAHPCPDCRVPLRFSRLVRYWDLGTTFAFLAVAPAVFLLLRAQCVACRAVFNRFPYEAPRVAIVVAGIAALPLFMAGARRIYLALMLRRGRQWEMLEVAEG